MAYQKTGRKVGRPTVADEARRTETVRLALTPREMERLREAAAGRERRPSEWARMALARAMESGAAGQ